MNLFTKPITEIQFEDIENFCKERIPEGIKVEYKSDFPNNKKLAKVVASFANTYGGIVLIGVNESDSKPILPIKGIDYFKGIYEKINSICLKSIEPPVFPEIQICPIPEKSNKVVVIIRVEESDETPHRVEHNTKVYIRMAGQSEPVLAPFEEIEWLMHRREKAIQNKERLLARAELRFREQPLFEKFAAFKKMHLIPLYPSKVLVDIDNLDIAIKNARLRLQGEEFPFNLTSWKSLNESIIFEETIESTEPFLAHLEINQFGLIWYKESFREDCLPEHRGKIHVLYVLEQLIKMVQFGLKLYKELGFWGALEINLTLEGVKNRRLTYEHILEEFESVSLDNRIEITRKTKVPELKQNWEEIILDIHKQFLWSCGAHHIIKDRNVLQQHLHIIKRELGLGQNSPEI